MIQRASIEARVRLARMQGHLRERSKGVWEFVVPLGRDPISGR